MTKLSNKSYSQKSAQVERSWHLVDVEGKILGRTATTIAQKLIGKHKATYTPHIDGGDYVVVVNASGVKLSRNKAEKKIYYRHTGYPGGLKERSFQEMLEKFPQRVIEKAVYNMLPKNKLRKKRMTRLKVYADATHQHQSQLKTDTSKE